MNVLTGTLRHKPHLDQKISYLSEGFGLQMSRLVDKCLFKPLPVPITWQESYMFLLANNLLLSSTCKIHGQQIQHRGQTSQIINK